MTHDYDRLWLQDSFHLMHGERWTVWNDNQKDDDTQKDVNIVEPGFPTQCADDTHEPCRGSFTPHTTIAFSQYVRVSFVTWLPARMLNIFGYKSKLPPAMSPLHHAHEQTCGIRWLWRPAIASSTISIVFTTCCCFPNLPCVRLICDGLPHLGRRSSKLVAIGGCAPQMNNGCTFQAMTDMALFVRAGDSCW